MKHRVKHLLLITVINHWFSGSNLSGGLKIGKQNGCRRGVGAFSQRCRGTLEQGTVRPDIYVTCHFPSVGIKT